MKEIEKSKFRQLEDLYFSPKYLCSKFRENPFRTVRGNTTDRQTEGSPYYYSFAGLKTSEAKTFCLGI